MDTRPIGIFDSGVGGTSIWQEIHALLPYENTIYLADSLNAPYGVKGKDRIQQLSIKNTEFLLKESCKLIVVACNTATTNAIDILRDSYEVPFIGIEPAIKPAALQSKTGAIGILATKGTLSSSLFHKTSNLFASDVNVIEKEGEGIVQLIENGQLNSPQMHTLLVEYINPMLDANIDHLVLGCTHYPYLIPQLIDILPSTVKIIDSAEAVARQTKAVLSKHNLLCDIKRQSEHRFLINKNPEVLRALLGEQYDIRYASF